MAPERHSATLRARPWHRQGRYVSARGELMPYEMILTERREHVGLITLNRPQAMNALNNQLMRELMDALEAFDKNEDVGAMIITGNEKAFAAGADINEMADKSIQ